MAPCLLWERLKDFIALGDNSVSTAICAECLFSLSSTLLPLSHFLCLLLLIRDATQHLGSFMSPALAPSACKDRAVQHCGTLEQLCCPVSADADQSALLESSLQGLQQGSVCVQALPVARCCRMDWCEHLTAPPGTAACSEDGAVAESSRLPRFSTSDCSEEVSSRAVRGLLDLSIQYSPLGQQPFQLSDP